MMRYSVQPRDRIFVKSYGFLSFAKNKGKNIGKNITTQPENIVPEDVLLQRPQDVP